MTESVRNLYPWGKIALFCGLLVFSTLFVSNSGQRVRKLDDLPDD